jgi:hypothetical protein
MIEQEYYTVKQISKMKKMSRRNVIKIIHKILPNCTKEMVHKNKSNQWLVLHTKLELFTAKNKKRSKYYGLTIDPVFNYSQSDIHTIMEWVYTYMNDDSIEINYVIEQKTLTGTNHIHCYINCNQKRKLIQSLRLGFSQISYKESEIFDLTGWKDYIKKQNKNKITTLKK